MLTAINEELEYLNPSLYTQTERDLNLPRIRKLANQGGIICPHCLVVCGQKHEVSLVNPKEKIIHFRHKKGDRSQECLSYKGESDQHLTAKLSLLGELSIQGVFVEVETRKYGETGLFRTPDVTATLANGQKHAHEIQVSSITVEKLKERTDALMSIGFVHVHWYLAKKNIKDENVNFLIDHDTSTPYHLQFDNAGLPFWSAMLAKITRMATVKENSPHAPYQYDHAGQKWTYHVKADTLAFYVTSESVNRHVIRLPGLGTTTVTAKEVLCPSTARAGTLSRWPCLSKMAHLADNRPFQ
jgi:competence CoiA-like predicted nuclease